MYLKPILTFATRNASLSGANIHHSRPLPIFVLPGGKACRRWQLQFNFAIQHSKNYSVLGSQWRQGGPTAADICVIRKYSDAGTSV